MEDSVQPSSLPEVFPLPIVRYVVLSDGRPIFQTNDIPLIDLMVFDISTDKSGFIQLKPLAETSTDSNAMMNPTVAAPEEATVIRSSQGLDHSPWSVEAAARAEVRQNEPEVLEATDFKKASIPQASSRSMDMGTVPIKQEPFYQGFQLHTESEMKMEIKTEDFPQEFKWNADKIVIDNAVNHEVSAQKIKLTSQEVKRDASLFSTTANDSKFSSDKYQAFDNSVNAYNPAKDVKTRIKAIIIAKKPVELPPAKASFTWSGYTCEVCHKVFRKKGALTRHSKIHAGKPWPEVLHCVPCDKTYKKPKSFAKHQSLHEPGNGYICTTCQKAYK